MKKNKLLPLLLIFGLASCVDNVLVDSPVTGTESNDVITFENVLANKATRAMKTTFAKKDSMGIYGFQDTLTMIFNNQKVSFDGDKWTYSPLKYWNAGSMYEFYGIYPSKIAAADTYTFNDSTHCFTITDFEVANDTVDQVDVMIAEENHTKPFNTVSMNFNHLLSNINFYAKLSNEITTLGVDTIKFLNLEITGLKNSGTFNQSGFNSSNKNVEGEWTDLHGKNEFLYEDTVGISRLYKKGTLVYNHLAMPQPLSATLSVKYAICYKDGSSTTFRKSIPLESIMAGNDTINRWKMNTVYTYTMTLNPNKVHQNTYYPDSIDWNGSIGGDLEPVHGSKLVGPDGKGNYYVEVDTTGNDTADVKYPVVWEDIDGDGRLEGGVDRDADGKIDNVDNDTINRSQPSNPLVSDGDSEHNPGGKDVILVDTDGDGKPDTQLERDPDTKVIPENPTYAADDATTVSGKKYTIDWNGSLNADSVNIITGNDTIAASNAVAGDERKPVKYSRLVQHADGEYYVEVDLDHDGVYNTKDTCMIVRWADLDGDGKLEGFVANVDGDNTKNGNSSLPTDGNKKLNPNGYDVILIDTNGDGVCDTQLEKSYVGCVYPSDDLQAVIEFDAKIETWENHVTGVEIINGEKIK